MELQRDAKNKYFDPYQKMWTTKILPGEFHVAEPGELIVTTLGSCIAACIRDKTLGIGGMNHFMLPASDKGEWAGVSASTRFGNFAMEHLINEIIKKGGLKANMEASILGGGQMFGSQNIRVGDTNIAFAREYLATEGIPLVYEDVGGDTSRKVYFAPDTGKVIVKKFATVSNNTIQEREESFAKDISSQPVEGDIELF